MKAMKIANTVFNPMHIQFEITTREELDALGEVVEILAPTDSQAAWLSEKQYDFVFRVLVTLRNAARMDVNKEVEIK